MNNKALLTGGSVQTHLIRLALPALIGLLCTFSFMIVDTYFVSRLGHYQLAAFGFVMSVVDFIIGITIGTGIAVSSVVARRIGAGHGHNSIPEYALHVSLYSLVIGILLMIIGWITIKPLFYFLGATNQVMPYIQQFMQIWYIGVFLLLFGFVGSNVLRAAGQPRGPAVVQISMAVINLLLDPVLIFILHLGIRGAAIAGLIARVLGALILLYCLINFKMISFKLSALKIKLVLRSWQEMIAIAIPASITNVIGPIATFWITYQLAKISQAAVAGFGVAAKIQMIVLIPVFVLSGSIGPIVGQNYTAGLPNRAYEALQKSCLFSVIWGSFVTLILLLAGKPMAAIFSRNTEVILIACKYLTIVPISFIAWGIIMMVNASFNALGYPKRSTMISFFRLIVCFLPLSLILKYLYGISGIFIAFSLSTFLLAIISYIWIKYFYKHKMSA